MTKRDRTISTSIGVEGANIVEIVAQTMPVGNGFIGPEMLIYQLICITMWGACYLK